MAEYPKTITIKLSLEIQISDLESESYFLAEPQAEGREQFLTSAFLSDLFDIFEYEGSIGIERINKLTKNQVAKALLQSSNQKQS